jgi:hypothetical protein
VEAPDRSRQQQTPPTSGRNSASGGRRRQTAAAAPPLQAGGRLFEPGTAHRQRAASEAGLRTADRAEQAVRLGVWKRRGSGLRSASSREHRRGIDPGLWWPRRPSPSRVSLPSRCPPSPRPRAGASLTWPNPVPVRPCVCRNHPRRSPSGVPPCPCDPPGRAPARGYDDAHTAPALAVLAGSVPTRRPGGRSAAGVPRIPGSASGGVLPIGQCTPALHPREPPAG